MQIIALVVIVAASVAFVIWRNRWQLINQWRGRHLMRSAKALGFSQFGNRVRQDSIFPERVRSLDESDRPTHTMQFETTDLSVTLFEVLSTQQIPRVGRGTTCLLFQSQQLELPEFFLRPEGYLDKVGIAFGWQDLDFGQRPVFSNRYLLQGADEQSVRYFFSDDMIDLFEEQGPQWVEAGHDRLLISRSMQSVSPRQFAKFFAEAFRIFEKTRTLNQALQNADRLEQKLVENAQTTMPEDVEPAADRADLAAASTGKASRIELEDKEGEEEYLVL